MPATTAPVRHEFSGQSNQATALFALQTGLTRFESTHDGESNFMVYLLDADGNQVSLVANTIGAGPTSKAVKISVAGQYLLNVMADGAWTVTVVQ